MNKLAKAIMIAALILGASWTVAQAFGTTESVEQAPAGRASDLVGADVTVYLTGEALGDSVGSVFSDSMNGRRLSMSGSVVSLGDDWIVLDSRMSFSSGATEERRFWIARAHVLAIRTR